MVNYKKLIMNKLVFIFFAFVFQNISFSQEIRISEETHYFVIGSKNAIVLNIPYGNKEIIEQQLKKELKNWGGKYDSGKGEFKSIQAESKFMGNKPFDAYVKLITESDKSIKLAFGIDLGGAFLTSREHPVQFKAMNDRLRTFAYETALACIENEIDVEKKELNSREKDKKSLEKDQNKLEEDIDDYKKKIVATERKIDKNKQEQEKVNDEIKRQKEIISEIEKKKKSLR